MEINNPISQLAKMYNMLEAHLRKAAHDNTVITIKELRSKPDVAALEKSPWQVRDALKTFRNHGHLVETTKGGRGHEQEYYWDVNSPPFVLGKRIERRKKVDPSKPVVVNSGTDKPLAAPEPNFVKLETKAVSPKEIELVFGDKQIIIGTNPVTGRMRITIEES